MKNFLFTLTTGRSGTSYLAGLLRMPAPQNVGRSLVTISAAEEASIRQLSASVGLDSPSAARRSWRASTPR